MKCLLIDPSFSFQKYLFTKMLVPIQFLKMIFIQPKCFFSKWSSWVPPAELLSLLNSHNALLSLLSPLCLYLMFQMYMSYLFHQTMNSLAYTQRFGTAHAPGNAKKCLIHLYITYPAWLLPSRS